MEYLKISIQKRRPNLRIWGQHCSKGSPNKIEFNQKSGTKIKNRKMKSAIKLLQGQKKRAIPKAYDKENLLKQIEDETKIKQQQENDNIILQKILKEADEQIVIRGIVNMATNLRQDAIIKLLESIRSENSLIERKLQQKKEELGKVEKSPKYTQFLQESDCLMTNKAQLKYLKEKYKELKNVYGNQKKIRRRMLNQSLTKQSVDNQTLENACLYQLELDEQLNQLKQEVVKAQGKKNELFRKKKKLQEEVKELKGLINHGSTQYKQQEWKSMCEENRDSFNKAITRKKKEMVECQSISQKTEQQQAPEKLYEEQFCFYEQSSDSSQSQFFDEQQQDYDEQISSKQQEYEQIWND